jgi:hypothetical protein
MLRECVNASLILPKKKTLCLLIAAAAAAAPALCGQNALYVYVYMAGGVCCGASDKWQKTHSAAARWSSQPAAAQQRGASPRRKDVYPDVR